MFTTLYVLLLLELSSPWHSCAADWTAAKRLLTLNLSHTTCVSNCYSYTSQDTDRRGNDLYAPRTSSRLVVKWAASRQAMAVLRQWEPLNQTLLWYALLSAKHWKAGAAAGRLHSLSDRCARAASLQRRRLLSQPLLEDLCFATSLRCSAM